MFLAELTGLETASLIGSLIFGAIGVVVAIVAMIRKQDVVISPQPITVELVKALHEQFAAKADFDKLVESNTARHGQLFKAVEGVRDESRKALEDKVAAIQLDRQRTMERLNEKLGEQFSFLRESLAAINTELKLRRENDLD